MKTRYLGAITIVLVSMFSISCGGTQKPTHESTDMVSTSPEPTDIVSTLLESESSPPLLPNMLVRAEGQVWLRRSGWIDFIPVGFGVTVEPGDMLRVGEGHSAAVFCGEETMWDEAPQDLPADGLEHGVPCQIGRPPRPWSDVVALRSESEDNVPYVLRPRDTSLINQTPSLYLHTLPDIESYTISLISDDGQERPPVEIDGGETAWPSDWSPMEAGATYVLVVNADGRASDQSDKGHTGLGFWLLDSEDIEEVAAKEEQLRASSMSPKAKILLVAELYNAYGLSSEAIELLEDLISHEESPTVWLALGKLYLESGLSTEASEAFKLALAMAEMSGQQEMAAHAFVGLAMAYRLTDQETEAQSNLESAGEIYLLIGDQDGVLQVDELISR